MKKVINMKKILALLIVLSTFSANSQKKHQEYYKNGQLKSVGRYKNGKKVKKWKKYYENGQLASKGRYKINTSGHSYKIGKWKAFDKNGDIKQSGRYEGINKKNIKDNYYQKIGKWKSIDLYGNSAVKYYQNGVKSGIQKIYHKDGWLYGSAIYYNNEKNADFIKYYKNGKILQKWEVVNNEANGKFQLFYENGQLKLDGQKKDSGLNGIIELFHKNGKHYQTQEWKSNDEGSKLLNITLCLDSSGKTLDSGTLINGNGTVKEYINDELINIETFKNGQSKNSYSLVFFIWDNWEELNNTAWELYERTEDKISNKFTLKWIERSISLDKNYYNLDSYCAFLYRDGQYQKAIKIGLESIEFGKKNKIDTIETEKFIVEIKNKLNN